LGISKKHIIIVLLILGFVILNIVILNCPKLPEDINELGNFKTSKIYSIDKRILNFDKSVTWVSYDQISPNFLNAVIAIEDHRFYSHNGFVFRRMFKAIINDIFIILGLKKGFIEGGSSITQQLAKNLFLTPEKSLMRKITEFFTAIALEYRYSKNDILTGYCNLAYFGTDLTGRSIIGIEQAANYYFDKKALDLDINEAALLAGIIRAASYYSPVRHPERANQRRKLVLYRMYKCGYITKEEYQELKNEEVIINFKKLQKANIGQYFIDYVKSNFLKFYPWELYLSGNLYIQSTLDYNLQELLEASINKNMPKIDKMLGFNNDYNEVSYNEKLKYPQVASVVLKIPDGDIVAMVGGRDYFVSQYNRAIKAYRQLGSCFKPFNYLLAFNNKVITTESEFIDRPVVFINNGQRWYLEEKFLDSLDKLVPDTILIPQYSEDIEEIKKMLFNFYSQIKSSEMDFSIRKNIIEFLNYGKLDIYSPSNFSKKYYGKISLDFALANSVNTISTQILEQYDINELINFATILGFKNIPKSLSLALGTLDATPLQVAGAYLIFPNNGYFELPFSIKYIMDEKGNFLYKPYRFHKKIINGYATAMIRQLMEHVVDYGTARRIRQMGYKGKVAGKTGTSSNFRDAWFVGFTPKYLCVVWVGFDDNRPLLDKNGRGLTGGRLAIPIWFDFMKEADNNINSNFENYEDIDFYKFYESNFKKAFRFKK